MIVISQLPPGDDAGNDFSPTLPPPTVLDEPLAPDADAAPLASLAQPMLHDGAQVLLPFGLKGLRASMIDVEAMACLSAWNIGEGGDHGTAAEETEEADSASVPTAMATIVHLKRMPFDQTLTRQLDAQRWAYAWRVDDHRVAVAEVRYRSSNPMRTERDAAVVRQLCAAGIEVSELRRAEAVNDHFHPLASVDAAQSPGSVAASKRVPAGRGDRLALRLRGPWLLALGVAAVACLLAALQIGSSRQGEAQRLRVLTDATMTQHLARVLAAGDYGEVQGDLETFAGLGYFKGAVVVDARRRAVASAGAVPAFRIGQAVTGTDLAGARVVPLVAAASLTQGQLLIWGLDPPSPWSSAIVDRALFAASLLLGLAALTGAVLLWRLRRRRLPTVNHQPVAPPLSQAPP